MTVSNDKAYVWIYLKESIKPIVAGLVQKKGNKYFFTYGQSYLKHPDAISFYTPELPLQAGTFEPNWEIASCLRDASPDAWGRRVIIYNITGKKKKSIDESTFDELTFLLHSGSDRIGMLDFQISPTEYIARNSESIPIKDLSTAIEQIEKGKRISRELEQVIMHGTSIGGARPKVLVHQKDKKYIAKFSSSSDYYNIIKAEYIAMRIAELVGISVASVKLEKTAGKDVLLIERFDRINKNGNWYRLGMISGLTILGLNEMEARYASYEDMANHIRHNFTSPKKTLKELFMRMVFNILVGNTDDHARNHSAFWDGNTLSLTPAYDICPQGRSGQTASQAMKIHGADNRSLLLNCLKSSRNFLLNTEEAISIINQLIVTLTNHWEIVCKEAKLSKKENNFFRGNQFLNPYIFQDLDEITNKIRKPWKDFT